jgi:hypothetical protein
LPIVSVSNIAEEMAESKGVKRAAEEDMEVEDGNVQSKQESEPAPQRMRVQNANSHESSSAGAESTLKLNLPIPGSVGQACILKVSNTDFLVKCMYKILLLSRFQNIICVVRYMMHRRLNSMKKLKLLAFYLWTPISHF